jgi:hypothetical protein
VQAFAQPELQTTARIVEDSRKCSALTSNGAALISLVVTTDAQFCGVSKAISAKSRLRGLIPAWTPARRTPGTAPNPPRSAINSSDDDAIT